MALSAQTRIQADPRNLWTRLSAALELVEAGDLHAADRIMQSVRYHADLTPEIRALFETEIARLARDRGGVAPRINTPADYLSRRLPVMHHPFHILYAGSSFPSPYPYGMVMPGFPGLRNDYGFIADAATQLTAPAPGRIHVVWTPLGCRDAGPLLAALGRQEIEGKLALTVLAGEMLPAGLDRAGPHEVLEAGPTDAAVSERLASLADEADLIVFLTGDVRLDDAALRRLCFLGRVSDNLVQPLMEAETGQDMQTPFTLDAMNREFGNRYPFRNARGMNFAISSGLLRRIGGPDTRFVSSMMAAREMLWRAWNLGAYVAPLGVPGLQGFDDGAVENGDADLFAQLCPNHWDRKQDGRFEVPKVSVYIPVYNAGRYIERAVDSVLAQDVKDLELCLHDDGSRDDTLAVLQARYGNEPRVRWQSNANGGIGFASNRAIEMSGAMYIGQLDSDDCLKPGAVRRLMTYMDEHPELACCYASCERVDAEGNYLQDEYSWPVFSREKMMITSIAHHFRMFRRSAWERTSKFREDIVNAVDYDIFLKMSEVGAFHHIDEKFYQRRWHGQNTSNVNEGFQTTNTYRVQREALKRLGLADYWDVHVPNPEQPRKVTYRRRADKRMVIFWPNYRSNPYQRLLYGKAAESTEFRPGKIEAALRLIESGEQPGEMVFHLHWLNFLFEGIEDRVLARTAAEDFLAKLTRFKDLGGRLVWTIHNTVSHDLPFSDLEAELSAHLAQMADVLHFHSEASIEEVETAFAIPRDKVRISPHGAYVGAYPDFVTRAQARAALGIADSDEVILFTGQVRPYKGVETLIGVFRDILRARPNALLLVAGVTTFDLLGGIAPALTPAERARIRLTDRFLEPMEMQLFFRAADLAVYPYQKILTSGSMLLALSFGVPVVIPRVGMTAEVLEGRDAGLLYDGAEGAAALETALRQLLEAGPERLTEMGHNARALAETLEWRDVSSLYVADVEGEQAS